MSRYTTVESIIWHDEKFRSLPEDARMLFLYLLTSPHSNMLGIFYLPKLYACSDLQWEPERYQRGIDTLCDTLLIEVDKDIVWIKNYLKHNLIKGPKQITGAVNRLMTLPDTKLIGPFMKNLEKHLLEDDLRLFKKLYTKPYEYPSDTLSNTLSDTLCDTPSIAETETETVTVTETETESKPDPVVSSLPPSSDDLDIVLDAWRQHIGELGPKQLDAISAWLKESDRAMPAEVVVKAIEIAAQSGVRRLNYVEGILRNWLNDGVRTLEDIERAEQRKHRSRGAPAETRPRFDREAYERMLREEGLYREARTS